MQHFSVRFKVCSGFTVEYNAAKENPAVSLAVTKSICPSPSLLPDRFEILFFLPVSEHPPSLFKLLSVSRLSV